MGHAKVADFHRAAPLSPRLRYGYCCVVVVAEFVCRGGELGEAAVDGGGEAGDSDEGEEFGGHGFPREMCVEGFDTEMVGVRQTWSWDFPTGMVGNVYL